MDSDSSATSVADNPRLKQFRFAFVPLSDSSGGGIYQYSLTMQRALGELRSRRDDAFVLVIDGQDRDVLPLPGGFDVTHFPATGSVSPIRQLGRRLPASVREPARRLARRLGSGQSESSPLLELLYQAGEIDLVIHPVPTLMSAELGIPYVMAIHDLQHRLQPEFPEVSANGEWEAREHLFNTSISRATVIITDSGVGREDVLDLYDGLIDAERVCVLPFLSPPYLVGAVSEDERVRVRAAHRLPDRYLFYPSHFWPHKNHVRIVEALGLLDAEGLEVTAVFTGTAGDSFRAETLSEVRATAERLGVGDRVHLTGYLPDGDIAAVYAEAEALIMPTFFGPTNIPVLEAWSFDCPVITSDLRGIREQVGDAALLADPRSSESIAEAIRQLWDHDDIRAELGRRGRDRLATYTADDYRQRLNEVLDTAKAHSTVGNRSSRAF